MTIRVVKDRQSPRILGPSGPQADEGVQDDAVERRRWAGVRCRRSVVKRRQVSKVGMVVASGQHDEAPGGCRGLL
ncbi:hypothetical protein AMK23_34090 [Streptomyces sp. CB02130]|uniref:hypothetical protein n=1 Tax=Streptomyces sp. CB02130 TaxID=1703934 RepID=UPI0009402583|nr:hypothetical protein [Streptomyces sp. CB02130]OKJ19502.1 hypothetical protein AMK23_34090 [Streptomyces sp. CB02130]